jgi:hypothetical protein
LTRSLLTCSFAQESREARYSAVRAVLEDNVKLREKSEARFQAFFDKELNRLKNDFRNEAEVRNLFICFPVCTLQLNCLYGMRTVCTCGAT